MGRCLLVCAVALCVGLAGCSGGERDREAEPVRAVVTAWATELANATGTACRHLTPGAQRRLVDDLGLTGLFGCDAAIGITLAPMDRHVRAAFARVKIRRVRVDGDRAEIAEGETDLPDELEPYRLPNDGRPTVLRRVSGVWKIDDLG